MRVVAHNEDSGVRWCIGGHNIRVEHDILKCVSRGLEISIPIATVRFEISSFRPFVPGVDEDESIGWFFETRQRVPDRVFEPGSIFVRRRSNHDSAASGPPCFIVPRRANPAKQLVGRRWITVAATAQKLPIVYDAS